MKSLLLSTLLVGQMTLLHAEATLATGWNLLGATTDITNPKETYNADIVWSYNGGWTSNPESISQGYGFWVKVSETPTETEEDEHDHGEDLRVVVFYNADTNDHIGYDVAETQTIDLNLPTYSHDGEDIDISNMNLTSNESGVPFIWLDNKGDTDAANDEEKLIMLKSTYDYATDGNLTWEDFYYLAHFHAEEENGETHYHLGVHSNDEFNVTEGAKLAALGRINAYLAEQKTLEETLEATIPTAANGLCGFYTNIDLEEDTTTYYAMGTNGIVYVYDEDKALLDYVVVSDSCVKGEMGMSGVEHGVWIFLANTQEVHVVDSHDDGVYHVHNKDDVSDYVGAGKTMKTMVSIKPVDN